MRFKVGLVALGYRQEFGVNYFKMYAPVANMNLICLLLDTCAEIGGQVMQFDVDTSFLYAEQRETCTLQSRKASGRRRALCSNCASHCMA